MRRAQAAAPRERDDNEYLREVRSYVSMDDEYYLKPGFAELHFKAWQARPVQVGKYAWAVPSEEALRTVAKYGPIIEMGAGTGYWAYLLKKRGVSIRAYDVLPPNRSTNGYHPDQPTWTTVYRGGAEKSAAYPKRALFLCWPPYDTSMAHVALKNYRGSTVIYVGEGRGGCTADDAFHELLERDFEQVEEVALPQWPGIHDRLTVWKRKVKSLPSRTVEKSSRVKP